MVAIHIEGNILPALGNVPTSSIPDLCCQCYHFPRTEVGRAPAYPLHHKVWVLNRGKGDLKLVVALVALLHPVGHVRHCLERMVARRGRPATGEVNPLTRIHVCIDVGVAHLRVVYVEVHPLVVVVV